MNPPDRERLVNAWLTYQKNWWAFEALMKLWRESPDEALDVIINLARSADDDELVEAVGAGPLEDLIREHGASMIDAIETRAKSDLRFRQALSHVWIAKEDATSFVGQRYIALGCTPVGAKHCAQPDGPALSSLLVRTGAARRLVRTLMSANGPLCDIALDRFGSDCGHPPPSRIGPEAVAQRRLLITDFNDPAKGDLRRRTCRASCSAH